MSSEDSSDYEDVEESCMTERNSSEDPKELQELSNEEDIHHFSNPVKSVPESDVVRSEAVRLQLGVWDGLLETRIKLQKPLAGCNTLPRKGLLNKFTDSLDKIDERELAGAREELRNLLKDLAELQDDLLNANPAIVKSSNINVEDDEEIASDDEEIPAKAVERISDKLLAGNLSLKVMENLFDVRHRDMLTFRNSTLENWAAKTRQFSVGNKKGFAAFEQPLLQQIQHILADKNRLVERTQVARSNYRILGASTKEIGAIVFDDSSKKPLNTEIFDDDDFYHQLLKELIERKTDDTTDPIELSRQQIQLQQLRRKTKKVVDPKSSRDRKVKLDPIPKLINFMASQPVCQITEQSRSDLFKSLFGKMLPVSDPVPDLKLNEGLGLVD